MQNLSCGTDGLPQSNLGGNFNARIPKDLDDRFYDPENPEAQVAALSLKPEFGEYMKKRRLGGETTLSLNRPGAYPLKATPGKEADPKEKQCVMKSIIFMFAETMIVEEDRMSGGETDLDNMEMLLGQKMNPETTGLTETELKTAMEIAVLLALDFPTSDVRHEILETLEREDESRATADQMDDEI